VARALAEHPDRTIEATLAACPHCDHALGPADMTEVHAYPIFDTKTAILRNETW